MSKQKTDLEKYLDEFNIIKEAMEVNSKEILSSLMKEEISKTVQERLLKEEETDEEETEVEELETEAPVEDSEEMEEIVDDEVETDEMVDTEIGDEDELELDIEDSDLEDLEVSDDMDVDMEMPVEDEVDMTTATDEEVLSIFKKLTDSDEIAIVDGSDEMSIDVREPGEYLVKKGSGLDTSDVDMSEGMYESDEEPLYEIEFGDEMGYDDFDDEDEDFDLEIDELDLDPESEGIDMGDDLSDDEEEFEIELDENKSRALPDLRAQRKRPEGKKEYRTAPIGRGEGFNESVQKYKKLENLVESLKTEIDGYKSALKSYKGKLLEGVLTNSKLAYITSLVTENTTTKEEKTNILSRFNEVSSLNEAKQLYKTIKGELKNKTIVSETVEKLDNKITGSGSQSLTETVAYADASTARIKELMYGKKK
jgi:hypothetical protein